METQKETQKRYYTLFINKNKLEIKLKLITEKNKGLYSDVVKRCENTNLAINYNELYTFSTNRKLLKDIALSIKQLWINELEINLKLVGDIKF